MAVAGAMVAACVGAMFRDHRKQTADSSMLHKMLRKPINYTEHAKCRMDCRCAANLLPSMPVCSTKSLMTIQDAQGNYHPDC